MIDLLSLQKQFILAHLRPGDTAADFTMGNGHDTEFLSKAVGPEGKVYAFDVQESAIRSTKERLSASCPDNYTLILGSHHLAREYIREPIKAGMFNLGWLPGGDRSVTTQRSTTIPAVRDAISLLDSDAILTVAVYPGHPEGFEEGREIESFLSGLSRFRVCATCIKIINSPTSPFFFLIESKDRLFGGRFI